MCRDTGFNWSIYQLFITRWQLIAAGTRPHPPGSRSSRTKSQRVTRTSSGTRAPNPAGIRFGTGTSESGWDFIETQISEQDKHYTSFSADCGGKQGQEDFALTSVCTAVPGSKNHGVPLLLRKNKGSFILSFSEVVGQVKSCNASALEPRFPVELGSRAFQEPTQTKPTPSLEQQGSIGMMKLASSSGLHCNVYISMDPI